MRAVYIASLCFVVFGACRSDNDDTNESNGNNDSMMVLSTSINWGGTPIDEPNATFYSDDQRPVRVIFPQVYLSEVRFVTSEGDTTHENDVLLLNSNQRDITLSSVAQADYEQIIFTLGLPYDINKSVRPIDFELNHPLGPQTPNMWWSWDDGYIFARVEGLTNHSNPPVDTLTDSFSWHLGFSENAVRDISLNLPSGDDWTLVFDVASIFSNATIPDELFTLNVRRSLTDQNIASYMSSAFRIE